MAAFEGLMVAALQFTAAADAATNVAAWQIIEEANWGGGSPDYPYPPEDEDFLP